VTAWRRKKTGGGPRKRARPVWRGPLGTATSVLTVAMLAAGAGGWSWQSGHMGRTADFAYGQLIALSAKAGLTVQEILVTGRRHSPRDALLAAVQLTRGAPTLGFDPHAAKVRIEALPWVRSASVQRLLPNTVVVRLVERRPLALWQNQGEFRLIDEHGDTIAIDRLDRFSDLLVVVGEDAPAHAGKLLDLLATQPGLRDRVKAAVRIGGRRWNLRLDNDIDVALPEEDPAGAWARLAAYERLHSILARDVNLVDLRLRDRLIVRRASQVPPAKGVAQKGRNI
jgi:cell division protein FtsQ